MGRGAQDGGFVCGDQGLLLQPAHEGIELYKNGVARSAAVECAAQNEIRTKHSASEYQFIEF